jgi:hypothetical protein
MAVLSLMAGINLRPLFVETPVGIKYMIILCDTISQEQMFAVVISCFFTCFSNP